jgi:hypothetical protein
LARELDRLLEGVPEQGGYLPHLPTLGKVPEQAGYSPHLLPIQMTTMLVQAAYWPTTTTTTMMTLEQAWEDR